MFTGGGVEGKNRLSHYRCAACDSLIKLAGCNKPLLRMVTASFFTKLLFLQELAKRRSVFMSQLTGW